MIVQVPLTHVRTIYTQVGDLFAWLCTASLFILIATALASNSVSGHILFVVLYSEDGSRNWDPRIGRRRNGVPPRRVKYRT